MSTININNSESILNNLYKAAQGRRLITVENFYNNTNENGVMSYDQMTDYIHQISGKNWFISGLRDALTEMAAKAKVTYLRVTKESQNGERAIWVTFKQGNGETKCQLLHIPQIESLLLSYKRGKQVNLSLEELCHAIDNSTNS